MSLADKDRIFTNVYGYQPWNLSAAQARGDWDNTKDLIARGRDASDVPLTNTFGAHVLKGFKVISEEIV